MLSKHQIFKKILEGSKDPHVIRDFNFLYPTPELVEQAKKEIDAYIGNQKIWLQVRRLFEYKSPIVSVKKN